MERYATSCVGCGRLVMVEREEDDGVCPDCETKPGANGRQPPVRERWSDERILEAIRAWAGEHGRPPRFADWPRDEDGHPSAYQVRALLGSWSAAVERAGVSKPQRTARRRPARVRKSPPGLADLTLVELAERVERHTAEVEKLRELLRQELDELRGRLDTVG